MLFFWTFYLLKSPKKITYQGFHKNIQQHTAVFNIDNNKKMCWFLKDHVTLKTEEYNDAENSALHHRNKLHLQSK